MKVYCSDCKHIVNGYNYYGDSWDACYNVKKRIVPETYSHPAYEVDDGTMKKPCRLNAHNDCKWYEPK